MPLRPEDLTRFEAAQSALDSERFRVAYDAFQGYLRGRLEVVTRAEEYRVPDGIAIERLAQLAGQFGQASVARELFEALAALYKRAENPICERLALLRLSHLELELGHRRRSLEVLEQLQSWSGPLENVSFTPRGLRSWEGALTWPPSSPGDRAATLALWYLVAGRACAANGRYSDAVAAFERGLEHTDTEESLGCAPALRLGRAHALLERGEPESALQGKEAEGAAGGPRVIAALELTARAQWMTGQLGSAKATYWEALQRAIQADLPLASGALRLTLAQVLVLINQTRAAQALAEEALELGEREGVGEVHQRARVLIELARLRRSSHASAAAIAPSVFELQMQSVGAFNARPGKSDRGSPAPLEFPAQESYLGTLEDRLLEFQDALATGRTDAAAELLRVIESFAESDSLLAKGRILVARGLWCHARRRPREALRELADAEAILGELQMLPEMRQLKRYQSWCLAMVGDRPRLEERQREELVLMEKLSDSLASGDRGLFWVNKWTAEEEAVAGELQGLVELRNRIAASFGWRRAFRSFALWWKMGRFFEHLDQHRTERLREALDLPRRPGSLLPWWLSLVTLPRSRAVVSILALPDRVFAGCLWSFGADLQVSPVPRLALRERVGEFHARLVEDSPKRREVKALREVGEALGLERLLAWLPPRVRALTILPDDVLLGIPFAALPFARAQIVDRWATSLGIGWAPRRRGRRIASSLLIAVPGGGGRFRELPHAQEEIASVTRICGLRDAAVLSVEQATRDAVLRRLQDTSHWHVASHGEFVPDAPGSSGIALWRGGTEDILTLRDLAKIDLRALRLAVVASCWSADNFVSPSRWVLSLPSVMHAAGAGTVVGSMWEMLDAVSAGFMAGFYGRLRKGMACDAAFRETLLECRDDELGRPRPLSHWAGLVLTGDTAPVEWRN